MAADAAASFPTQPPTHAPHLQTKTRNKDEAATAELSRLNVNKKMCADKNRAKINAANGGIVMDESSIRLLC